MWRGGADEDSSDAEGGAMGLNGSVYDDDDEAQETASPFLVNTKTAMGLQPRAGTKAQKNGSPKDPVYEAARHGNKAVVRALLMAGHSANGNLDDDTHNPPLYEAAKQGNVDVMNLLIQHKADILATDENGNRETALHAAAFANHFPVVHCLVEAAQIQGILSELLECTNAHRKTAEVMAKEQCNFKISSFLATFLKMEKHNAQHQRRQVSSPASQDAADVMKSLLAPHGLGVRAATSGAKKASKPPKRARPPPPGSPPLSQQGTPVGSPQSADFASLGPPTQRAAGSSGAQQGAEPDQGRRESFPPTAAATYRAKAVFDDASGDDDDDDDVDGSSGHRSDEEGPSNDDDGDDGWIKVDSGSDASDDEDAGQTSSTDDGDVDFSKKTVRRKAYSLSTQRQFADPGQDSQSSTGDGDTDDDREDFHARQESVFGSNKFSKLAAFSDSKSESGKRPDSSASAAAAAAGDGTTPRSAPDGSTATPSGRRLSASSMHSPRKGLKPVASPKPPEKKKGGWRMFWNRKNEELRKYENWLTEVRREQNKVQDLLRKQARADEECTADWEKKKVHLQEWCMKAFEKKFEAQHQRRRNLVQVVFQKLQMTNAILESLARELTGVLEKSKGHDQVMKKYKQYPETPTEFVAQCIGNHRGVAGLAVEQTRRLAELEAIEAEVERLQAYTTPLNMKERQAKAMRCMLDTLDKIKAKPQKQVDVHLEPDLLMEFASALWNYKSHKRDHFNRWLLKLRRVICVRRADGLANRRTLSSSSTPSGGADSTGSATASPEAVLSEAKGSPAAYQNADGGNGPAQHSPTGQPQADVQSEVPQSQTSGAAAGAESQPSSTEATDEAGGEDDVLEPEQVAEFLEAFIDHMFEVLGLANTTTNVVLKEGSSKLEARRRAFAVLVEAVAYPLLKSEGVFDVYLEKAARPNDTLYCRHKQYLQKLHPLHLGFDKDFYNEVRWQRSRASAIGDDDDGDLLYLMGAATVSSSASGSTLLSGGSSVDGSASGGARQSDKMYGASCRAVEHFCQCVGLAPVKALELLMSVISAIHKEAREFTSRPLDAEAFFPILVWCFVHCEAGNLASAVKYCEKFALTTPSITRQKYSEVMYYMTSMMGAMQWICSMSEGSKAKMELQRRQRTIEKRRFKRSDSIKAKMSSLMEGEDDESHDDGKLPGFDSPVDSPSHSRSARTSPLAQTSSGSQSARSHNRRRIGSKKASAKDPSRRRVRSTAAPEGLWDSPARPEVAKSTKGAAASTVTARAVPKTDSARKPLVKRGSAGLVSAAARAPLPSERVGSASTTGTTRTKNKKSAGKSTKAPRTVDAAGLEVSTVATISPNLLTTSCSSSASSTPVASPTAGKDPASKSSSRARTKRLEQRVTAALASDSAAEFLTVVRDVVQHFSSKSGKKRVRPQLFRVVSEKAKHFQAEAGPQLSSLIAQLSLLVKK